MDATFGAKDLQLALDGVERGGAAQVNLEDHHIFAVVDQRGQVENVDGVVGTEGGDGGDKTDAVWAGRGQDIDIFLGNARFDRLMGRREDRAFERRGMVHIEDTQPTFDLFTADASRKGGEQDHRKVAAQDGLAQIGDITTEAAKATSHIAHNAHPVARHDRDHKLVHGVWFSIYVGN